jgi:protocatechuate 3,4-dioxygenase beta subunit
MFDRSLGRREALGLLGGVTLTAVLAACGSSKSSSGTPSTVSDDSGSTGTGTSPSTAAGSVTSCNLAPEVTQGPYYLADHPETSDLVQDRPGTPLALALTVVGANCEPIEGAKVDVWHCDAAGEYGGIEGSNGGPAGGGGGGGAATRGNPDTWLQGVQTTDANGAVNFSTIWPGFYPGRTVHIHLKVFVNGTDLHTGQLFFPDEMNAAVLANSPYGGAPTMTNDDDSIFREAGSAALITPTKAGAGYTASAQLVVSA